VVADGESTIKRRCGQNFPESIHRSIEGVVPYSNETELSMTTLEAGVHDLMNLERRKFGLQPLAFSAVLMSAARGHAEDMRKRNYFASLSPDG
jgi:uncharacterized protein YkwD